MEANAITQDSSTTVDFQALAKAQPDLAILQTMQTVHLKCTAAEMVYGITLRLPRELFYTHIHTTQTPEPVSYSYHLTTIMQRLQPPSVRKHQQRKSHVHSDLTTSSYVFIRNDNVKKPLRWTLPCTQPDWQTLYPGKKKVFSLDRLKPAYMDTTLSSTDDNSSTKDSTSTDATSTTQDQPPTPAASSTSTKTPQLRVTRSSGHVHWPQKLAEYRSLP